MKKKLFTVFLTFAITLFSLPLLTTNSQAESGNVSKHITDLREKLIGPLYAASQGNSGRSKVIIMTSGIPSASLKNQVSGGGGFLGRSFKYVNGFAAEVPNGFLNALANIPFVKYIVPDSNFTPLVDITAGTVGADIAQNTYGYDGTGIGVAVIDTGITPHEDLQGRFGLNRIIYS